MDVREKIFHFAYEMAMRDATLRTAVLRREKNSSNESESINYDKIKILSGYSEARDKVKDYIDGIIGGKDIPCFYTAESAVEKKLKDFVKEQQWYDDAEFTFGNTQKLINMTAKYMFIACYNEDSLRERFRKCHCPMDNIIIEHIVKSIENTTFEDDAKKLAEKYMKQDHIFTSRRKWQGYLRQSWSNIRAENKGQYLFFQELVQILGKKQELSPLEYDLCYWGVDSGS